MTTTYDHDALRELVALHAIGALSPSERDAVDAHLATCAECAAELRAFAPVGMALAQALPQVDPPSSLRTAILDVARHDRHARLGRPAAKVPVAYAPWLAAAAMLVLAAGTTFYAMSLQRRIQSLESELQEARSRIDEGERRVQVALRSAAAAEAPLGVLTAPDVRRIDLAGQPAAPSASARAFWSRSRGLVITASNLPALPAGRIYQLWFVTAQAPVSAGLLTPDGRGGLTATLTTPSDVPNPVALAVTLEPEGGVPSPTGDKYLVGLAN
jgi:anti-sigma-K factor RskA